MEKAGFKGKNDLQAELVQDPSFKINVPLLNRATELLERYASSPLNTEPLINQLPEEGLGEEKALELLAQSLIPKAAKLGKPSSAAQMDPPTPSIAWAVSMWKAALNQNLLHPSTSPFSRVAEERVMSWLVPYFGMTGGQMTSGSTLANLTALWGARENARICRVVASDRAHLSIEKSAHILSLSYSKVSTNRFHQISISELSTLGDLSDAAVVFTAGTTSVGAIDSLELFASINCAWKHVDAAWAGPLCLSEKYRKLLAGIELADSVAISAHKLFFQPKDSAMILFKKWENDKKTISFGDSYLAEPNVGVLGSRGAVGEVLLATLLSWGRLGLIQRIERCMGEAEAFATRVKEDPRLELFQPPVTGIVVWRPSHPGWEVQIPKLNGICSLTLIDGKKWLRNVFANPSANHKVIFDTVQKILLEDSLMVSAF